MQSLLENVIIFDTETTSKDFKEAEIIELSASVYENGGWAVIHDELYKPRQPISPHVSAVNHITNRHVEDKDCFSKHKNTVQELFDGKICVAHNIFYDNEVLSRNGVDVPNRACTMRMARKLFANYAEVEAYNLSYLRYFFDLDIPEDTPVHRAAGDVLVTCKLFELLVQAAIETKELEDTPNLANDLLAWIDEPIITNLMPFGKYRGQTLDSVPLDYWQWALANMDSLNEEKSEYDRDFAASVEAALQKIMQ